MKMQFKKIGIIIVALLGLGIFFYLIFNKSTGEPVSIRKKSGNIKEVGNPIVKLTSLAFEDGSDIPSRYTCDGLNINPPFSISEVPEGAEAFVVGLNDFGENNYGGPCPPSGNHRYQFKLYALDITLDLSPVIKKKGLITAMQGHILAQDLLLGFYKKH